MTYISNVDQRRHPRARLAHTVRLIFADQPAETHCYTANLSANGMFVASRSAPPVGTMVKFCIDLGAGGGASHPDELVSGFGQVVWVRLKSRRLDEPCGMGIQFNVLAGDGQRKLARVVREALRQSSRASRPHGLDTCVSA